MRGVVFVSYENHDAESAASLCTWLEQHGCTCWIAPRDIQAGTDYAGEITRAIKSSEAFVLVCSDTTRDSEHVLNEVSIAFAQKITIVPYCLQGTVLSDSLEYFLAAKHRIDATSDQEHDYKTILDALESGKSRPAQAIAKAHHRWPLALLAMAAIAVAAILFRPQSGQEPGGEVSPDPVLEQPTTVEAQIPATEDVPEVTKTPAMPVEARPQQQQPALPAAPAEEPEPAGVEAPEIAAEAAQPEEPTPVEKPAPEPLVSILARAKSIHDLDGAHAYHPVTIDTPEQVLGASYILICNPDGSIISILSPQGAEGTRTDLASGATVDKVSYSKSDRVEYVQP